MSVLVKGMKMPENCKECMSSDLRTTIKCTEWTEISAGRRENERAWSCPLVEIPEKHGRLIDADALADDLEYDAQNFDDDHELKFNAAMWLRSNQNKVIVEAEGEG